MTPLRRLVALLGVGALGLSVTAGCSSGRGASAASAGRLRDKVASEVHDALNHSGVPVQYGLVSCEGPGPDGSIHCDADTAYEPAAEVVATFPVSPGTSGSCPGKLRITVGGSPLVSLPENPCRR